MGVSRAEIEDWNKLAHSRFGIPSLRSEQIAVLSLLREGNSVIGVLPTGAGKSICYQLPSLIWAWKSLVIVPLLSLLEDQRARAEGLGLRVFVATAGDNNPELQQWDIAFITPERFVLWMRTGLWARIRKQISLLVFDEAHCLVDWRGFRPLLRELVERISAQSAELPPILLLSATLSTENIEELAIPWRREFRGVRGQIGRLNLYLGVVALETEAERWLHLVSHLRELRSPHSAIVYCGTRWESEAVAGFLQTMGMEAVAYHAGLNSIRRKRLEKAFRAGRLRVICATSAFGLGMDYPWVERVLHWGAPSDLSAYWQEVGRAGRSGAPAYCLLFWLRSDFFRWRDRMRRTSPLDSECKWKEQERMAQFLRLNSCRKQWIAKGLGWEVGECGNCDICYARASFSTSPPWFFSRRVHRPVWWLASEIISIYGEWPESRWIRESRDGVELEYCQALSKNLA